MQKRATSMLSAYFGKRRKPERLPMREPLCEILRKLPPSRYGNHPVQDYITAFEDSGLEARGVLDKGYDSIVFEIEGGKVLKATWLHLEPEFGKRPFDAPILDAGMIELGERGLFVKRVSYFVQPKVDMRATDADSASFGRMAESLGYEFQDPGPHQLGFHEDKLVLIDPFAIRPRGAPHWMKDRFRYPDSV